MSNKIIYKNKTLIRIFISEEDKLKGKPLYEQIVFEAKKLGLSGATVIRGILGYGFTNEIHSAKFLALSENLPIIIEIVEEEKNLKKIIRFLNENMKKGLVTLEKIKIMYIMDKN
ncbi:MAG: DUF190 domain-containing protein [Spirochaetia bacterium]|nr:DUF190 domain-containing protein [Spirochaetia bacterium]